MHFFDNGRREKKNLHPPHTHKAKILATAPTVGNYYYRSLTRNPGIRVAYEVRGGDDVGPGWGTERA